MIFFPTHTGKIVCGAATNYMSVETAKKNKREKFEMISHGVAIFNNLVSNATK